MPLIEAKGSVVASVAAAAVLLQLIEFPSVVYIALTVVEFLILGIVSRRAYYLGQDPQTSCGPAPSLLLPDTLEPKAVACDDVPSDAETSSTAGTDMVLAEAEIAMSTEPSDEEDAENYLSEDAVANIGCHCHPCLCGCSWATAGGRCPPGLRLCHDHEEVASEAEDSSADAEEGPDFDRSHWSTLGTSFRLRTDSEISQALCSLARTDSDDDLAGTDYDSD